LYFGKIPTELDPEQVYDYLFYLQKSPKHLHKRILNTRFDLRFLKSEGLPYEYLRLPSIKHEKKLPVVLSKAEVWCSRRKFQTKNPIGLLYGCGLRCMEARSVFAI
jgi:integrase